MDSVSSVFLEAIPAVNRSAFGRREGNLALYLAVSAGCLVHLTRSKTSRTTESSTICHFLFSFFSKIQLKRTARLFSLGLFRKAQRILFQLNRGSCLNNARYRSQGVKNNYVMVFNPTFFALYLYAICTQIRRHHTYHTTILPFQYHFV
jgi:hypothetical protein